MKNITLIAAPTIKDSLIFKILSGVFLIFIAAQIEIPLKPVPITLQTMAVLYIGLCYTPKEAFYITVSYLILGNFGLPIFTKFNYGISGPTAGYLISFVPSSVLVSYLSGKAGLKKSWKNLFLICLLGTSLTFIMGITWLSSTIGFHDAIIYGLLPFIIPGICKAVILVSLLKLTNKA